jgi:formamidopyrimidine-DNA glycosylase
MPELPDLEYIAGRLGPALRERRISAARVVEPVVLRVTVPGEFSALVTGRTIRRVWRRGHFMSFALDDRFDLVVNLMLAGRFQLVPTGERSPAALCFALAFDGDELRYVDEKKMGKVYLVERGNDEAVAGLGRLGLEVLSPAFTLEAFLKLARKRRDQVRAFLMDKRALASVGNAYADEILFAAGIHPKTRVGQLQPAELEVLYQQIGRVLRDAIAEIGRRGEPIDHKVRDFLQVRGRRGKPCPRCGTTLRAVRVLDGDACFCPRCQPARRSQFIDWQKLPR